MIRLRKSSGQTSFVGSLFAGGTPGQVLTVQTDGSVSPAPGGGSQPFDPSTLTGLALWLDASDEATINAGSPADDDPVSAWADKSGNGFDAAQAVSDNQPTYKTAIQNGLGAVRCDPSSFPQFVGLSGAGLGLFRDKEAVTVAIAFANLPSNSSDVFEASNNAGDKRRFALDYVVAGDWVLTLLASNDDAREDMWNLTWGTLASTAGDGGVALPYVAVGTLDLRVDQARVQSAAALAVTGQSWPDTADFGPFPDTPSDSIVLGGAYGGGSAIEGYLYELIVCDGVLPLADRRELLEYLHAKWGFA